ncbi:MAG: DUF2130 domain-containing protein [Gemmatimonadetes bacterium]|nr:DUF2130 domain-containing protein [Gemmatimonadota bacterium]
MSTATPQGEPTIGCPNCGTKIPLSEALSAQVREQVRVQFEAAQHAEDEQQQAEFERRLKAVRETAANDAREKQALELADMQERIKEREGEVETLRKNELELRKRERELADRQQNLELESARRLQLDKEKVEKAAIDRLTEQHRLQDLAKDRMLSDLREQLAEANAKAQQGSQQTQGAAMEADLEESLREAFPPDAIEPVATGQRGADLLQKVRDARGAAVGGILWEIKNTKVFSDKWLGKLREDQRACGADIAVIVTKAMPDGIASFGQQDGVWIVSPSLAPALAGALRHGLLETARARVASDNQNEKQAALYAYLSGLEFKQRIESILEPLLALHAEQEKDRRAIEAGVGSQGEGAQAGHHRTGAAVWRSEWGGGWCVAADRAVGAASAGGQGRIGRAAPSGAVRITCCNCLLDR